MDCSAGSHSFLFRWGSAFFTGFFCELPSAWGFFFGRSVYAYTWGLLLFCRGPFSSFVSDSIRSHLSGQPYFELFPPALGLGFFYLFFPGVSFYFLLRFSVKSGYMWSDGLWDEG